MWGWRRSSPQPPAPAARSCSVSTSQPVPRTQPGPLPATPSRESDTGDTQVRVQSRGLWAVRGRSHRRSGALKYNSPYLTVPCVSPSAVFVGGTSEIVISRKGRAHFSVKFVSPSLFPRTPLPPPSSFRFPGHEHRKASVRECWLSTPTPNTYDPFLKLRRCSLTQHGLAVQ